LLISHCEPSNPGPSRRLWIASELTLAMTIC
jgi:hypothetical protein